jgi:hypothetical protein
MPKKALNIKGKIKSDTYFSVIFAKKEQLLTQLLFKYRIKTILISVSFWFKRTNFFNTNIIGLFVV